MESKQEPFNNKFFDRAVSGTHFKNVCTYLIVHIFWKQFDRIQCHVFFPGRKKMKLSLTIREKCQ